MQDLNFAILKVCFFSNGKSCLDCLTLKIKLLCLLMKTRKVLGALLPEREKLLFLQQLGWMMVSNCLSSKSNLINFFSALQQSVNANKMLQLWSQIYSYIPKQEKYYGKLIFVENAEPCRSSTIP